MQNMFSLDGKIAIVTGGVGLLGQRHSEALARAGAIVVVTDVSKDACLSVANRLATLTAKETWGHAADITKPESLEILKKAVLEKFGKIDILVNNAAINDMFENPQAQAELSKFENYPLELWKKSLEVNVTGTFLCSQILGSEMAKRGQGSIVNIASTYGIVAPDQSLYKKPDGTQAFYKSAAYPTTKGAVISFTRFLAAYWGEKGVRVNCISPGGVENSQDEYFVNNYSKKTPLGRMAQSTDYQGALVFLASDASNYMTGANLVVDGGFTIW